MKPLTNNKLKKILDAAHSLDAAIIDIFAEEPLSAVAWIENKGLASLPEDIFLRPWMEQERPSLALIWRARNELFEVLQELDDRPLLVAQIQEEKG